MVKDRLHIVCLNCGCTNNSPNLNYWIDEKVLDINGDLNTKCIYERAREALKDEENE